MRLIDADRLSIYKYGFDIFEEVSPHTAYKEGWNNGIDAIIENASTVDAEPVRHGQWIKVEDDYNNCLYECSYCHTWTSLPTEEDSNGHIRYCWSCGAKMDGDSNTNSMH